MTARINGCIVWPNHGWFFEQWLAQQNTELVNNGNGRDARPTDVQLTSEAAINIVEWHKDMYAAGYYAYPGVQRDWPGTVQAFNAQQIPFIMTSSASAGGIMMNAADNDMEVRTSMMVYDGEVGWTGNILGGATMWITDGLDPEVEDGAMAFLLFFSNTENSASWHQTSGYVPVRNSSIELLESQGWYEANPNFLTASIQLGDFPGHHRHAGRDLWHLRRDAQYHHAGDRGRDVARRRCRGHPGGSSGRSECPA